MASSGELVDRVTFFAPTATTDELRGQEVEYSTIVATVWGQWRTTTGRERLQAQAMETIPEYRVTIYHRRDITTKMRALRVGGTEGMCDVVAVTEVEGRRFLEVDLVRSV